MSALRLIVSGVPGPFGPTETQESRVEIIDLSQDIYQGMQVYPGHLKTVVFDHASHEDTAPRFEGGFSFQTKGFMINDNGPTHVDSFSHLDPDP
ncbi:MAG: cyclase, partial [Marmoricola sp.]|nr:cyclase [Marmoricola sp.]